MGGKHSTHKKERASSRSSSSRRLAAVRTSLSIARSRKDPARALGDDPADSVALATFVASLENANVEHTQNVVLEGLAQMQDVRISDLWASLMSAAPSIRAAAELELTSEEVTKLLTELLLPEEAPRCAVPKVKVFLSSTFTDTQAERDSFLLFVDMHLQALAAALGCEYEVVEMRWGISDEMTRSHLTTKTCLRAIDKCNTESDALSFLYINTDKFGYRDVPSQIGQDTMEQVLNHAGDSHAILLKAYRMDSNALRGEGVFVIQDLGDAGVSENEVHAVLVQAASEAGLDELAESLRKSVTFREVEKGILSNPSAEHQAFCFMRELTNIANADDKNFFDNQEASIERLRELVGSSLPSGRVDTYSADHSSLTCNDDALSSSAVRGFLWRSFAACASGILEASTSVQFLADPFLREICVHAERAAAYYQGAAETSAVTKLLFLIREKLDTGNAPRPRLVGVHGQPGVGKSTLLALFARSVSASSDATVVYRHVASYGGDAIRFMRSVARQLEWLKNEAGGHKSASNARLTEDGADLHSKPVTWDAARARFLAAVCGHEPGSIVLVLDGLDLMDRPVPAFIPNLDGQSLVFSASAPFEGQAPVSWLGMDGDFFSEFATPMHEGAMLWAYLDRAGRSLTKQQESDAYDWLERYTEQSGSAWTATRLRAIAVLAGTWPSWYDARAETSDPVVAVFEHAERFHGAAVVGAVASLIAVSRFGLSGKELLDILSIDDSILETVYQYWDRPVRRCPKVIVEQILEIFRPFLFHAAPLAGLGTNLYTWSSELFVSTARARYLEEPSTERAFRQCLVDYFTGTFVEGKEYGGKLYARLVPAQALVLEGHANVEYNLRRVAEVPFQLLKLRSWNAFIEHHGSIEMHDAQATLSDGTQGESIFLTQLFLRMQPTSSYEQATSQLERAYLASISSTTPLSQIEALANFFLKMSWFGSATRAQERVLRFQEKHAPGSFEHVQAAFLAFNIAYRQGLRTSELAERGAENIERLQALIAQEQRPSEAHLQLLAEMEATQGAILLQQARAVRREGGDESQWKQLMDDTLALRSASLEERERLFGTDHPEVAKALSGLSATYRELGDYDRALEYAEKSLKVREKVLAANDPSIALTLENIHRALALMGEANDDLLVRAYDIVQNYYGNVHERVGRVLKALGEYFYTSGRFNEAWEVLQYAAETFFRVSEASSDEGKASKAVYKKKDLLPIIRLLDALQERFQKHWNAANVLAFEEWLDAAQLPPAAAQALRDTFAGDYISVAALICLSTSPEGAPLDVAKSIELYTSPKSAQAALDPSSARLNSVMQGALTGKDLKTLYAAIPAPKTNVLEFGSQPVMVVSAHGAVIQRRGDPKRPQPHVDFIATTLAEILMGSAMVWDSTEVLRSRRTLLAHPKSIDPNHLLRGEESRSAFYSGLGEWAGSNENGVVISCHGRSDWFHPSTGARGAITIGIGALQNHRPSASALVRDNLVQRIEDVLGDEWVVDCDEAFAGRGGKSWTNLTNQFLSFSGSEACAVDLTFSRSFRQHLVVKAVLRERLAEAIRDALGILS